ncbi:MAG: hypothetical protein R6X25_03790 [Candidatus Krumholzibacteriia bacterium]
MSAHEAFANHAALLEQNLDLARKDRNLADRNGDEPAPGPRARLAETERCHALVQTHLRRFLAAGAVERSGREETT